MIVEIDLTDAQVALLRASWEGRHAGYYGRPHGRGPAATRGAYTSACRILGTDAPPAVFRQFTGALGRKTQLATC